MVASYKPGDAEKLRVDSGTLCGLNPSLVYAQITGYGLDDPRAGYDAVIQARAGIAALQRKGAHFPYNTSKENLDSPPPQIFLAVSHCSDRARLGVCARRGLPQPMHHHAMRANRLWSGAALAWCGH